MPIKAEIRALTKLSVVYLKTAVSSLVKDVSLIQGELHLLLLMRDFHALRKVGAVYFTFLQHVTAVNLLKTATDCRS